MPHLLSLPNETLVHILCRANPTDIQICRQVCRLLWKLIDSSVELLYLLELHSLGYVPPAYPHPGNTYTDFLKTLRAHGARWRSLSDVKAKRYALNNITAGYTSTYDFYGGVYARGSTLNSLSNSTRRLELHQLPSTNRGVEYKQWTHEDLGVDTRDFAMEPDFDLLVLAELTGHTSIDGKERGEPNVMQHFAIHLRSLETCAPHPDAARPKLSHSLHAFAHASWSFYFQVVGRYLAVLFLTGLDQRESNRTSQMKVWDWTTGDAVTHIDIVSGESKSFSFISDRLVVVPRHQMRIRQATTERTDIGALDLYTFDDPPNGSAARLIATLELPLLPPGIRSTARIACRSDPAPSPSSPSAVWPKRRPRLFELSSTNRVLCLQIQLAALDPAQEHFTEHEGKLFVPFKDILDAVSDLYGNAEPSVIPWDAWAHGTSWVDTDRWYTGNECYVFGQRVVSTIRDEPESDHGSDSGSVPAPWTQLVVLDFDPVRLSKRKHRGEELCDPEYGAALPKPVEDDMLWNMFMEGQNGCKANAQFGVQTSAIKHRLNHGFYVMIDDEHVVIVLQNRHGAEATLVVYSF